MQIQKTEYMGFCFGVKNAVNTALDILTKDGKLYSYGDIIHNKDVVDMLKQKGLIVIDDINESLNDIDAKILIRSHGVGKKIIDLLEKNNIKYIDATCPKVKKIHNLVNEHSTNGEDIIVVGDENHPEIKGIIGWITGKYYTVNSIEDIKKINIDRDKKYCLVSQTTFNYNIYKEIVEFLKENDYTNIVSYNTICDATKNRQASCVEIARKSDIMLVIGDKSSSNTKKLYELCKENCEKTFLIKNYREIPYKYIDKNIKIGITAGASTPDWVIEEVIQYVRESEQNNE